AAHRAGGAPLLAGGGRVRRAVARGRARGSPRAARHRAGDGAGSAAGRGVRVGQAGAPRARRAAGAGPRGRGRVAVGGDLVRRRGPGAAPPGDRAFVAKKVVAAGQSPPPGWRCALGEAGRRRYAFHGAAVTVELFVRERYKGAPRRTRMLNRAIPVLLLCAPLAARAQAPQAQPKPAGKVEVLWLGQAAIRLTTPGGKVI